MNKICTSREQSKKLVELGLDTDTADMWYWEFPTAPSYNNYGYPMFHKGEGIHNVPCWSLSALMEIISKPTAFGLLIDGRGCRCHCRDKHEGKFYGTDDYCDNPIDACVEIIVKLKEMKLL